MCGIVCLANPAKNVSPKRILSRYLYQRSRGHDGYGYSYLLPSGKVKTVRFTDEAACFYHLGHVRSRLILLHHRLPTSTKNTVEQNQPIIHENGVGTFLIAHNGVISNAKELREKEHEGIAYSSYVKESNDFNDSESLLIELAQRITDGKKVRTTGMVAYVLLELNADATLKALHYGRNAYPLYHRKYKDGTHFLSSTHPVLTKKEECPPNTLFTLDWPGMTLRKRGCVLPYTKTVALAKTVHGGYLEFPNDRIDRSWHLESEYRYRSHTPIVNAEERRHKAYSNALSDAQYVLSHGDDFVATGFEVNKRIDEIDETIADMEEASISLYGKNTRAVRKARRNLYAMRKEMLNQYHEATHPMAKPLI